MEGFGPAMFAVIHNGNLYNRATDLLNSSIGEDGFAIWIDLPDGEQFVLPKGSKIRTMNYAMAIKEEL